MKVVLISVGDELLAGRVVDTHAALASSELHALGAQVVAHVTVGDPEGALAEVLRRECARADVVLVTGGLGPTEDDRTRSECAQAAGVPLDFHESWWAKIVERYRGSPVKLSERNQRQAFFPRGAQGIENPWGTAPAFSLPIGAATVYCLPGVPHEFRGLLTEVVLPELRGRLPDRSDERVWAFHGVPESTLDAWIVETLEAAGLPPDHHICVKEGEIEVRLRGDFDLLPAAREAFGARCLGEGDLRLPARVIAEARRSGGTVAVAESCTGGIISSRLTDVPGSSAVLRCGWVPYANEAKIAELGVDAREIAEHGAVSAPVAEALARGALERSGARWAVSTTGIAGPTGGSLEKPIGLIWFGVAGPEGVCAGVRRLPGDRNRVRSYGSTQALACLLAAIRGEDPFPWAEGP
jgi:nicotinamide-nucleotide amidase